MRNQLICIVLIECRRSLGSFSSGFARQIEDWSFILDTMGAQQLLEKLTINRLQREGTNACPFSLAKDLSAVAYMESLILDPLSSVIYYSRIFATHELAIEICAPYENFEAIEGNMEM